MNTNSSPKHVRVIERFVAEKLKLVKGSSSELLEAQQLYRDQVLQIFQVAFKNLIDSTITYSSILNEIKNAYEDALRIRDERITQFITQDAIMESVRAGAAAPAVLVLDGGFSSQLSRQAGARAAADGDPLWSARSLHTHPDAVVAAHLDFLRAGADVVCTNTYQASVGGFVEHIGVTAGQAYALIRRAVELAKRARTIYMEECVQASAGLTRRPLVAGSVGPYGAHLADGSEYDGSYADTTSVETMRVWHMPRITALVESGVDLLALETIPCRKEAEMLVELIKDFPDTKAWISFSCKDDKSLAGGGDFQTVAKKCWNLNPGQLVAVGVNCCSPAVVAGLFRGINDDKEQAPIPLITYPNSGEKYNPGMGWTGRDQCQELEHFVEDWLDLGVRYVGGCCRTYDTDISHIRHRVDSWCEQEKT